MADRSGEESESQLSIHVKIYFFRFAMDHGMCNLKIVEWMPKKMRIRERGGVFKTLSVLFPAFGRHLGSPLHADHLGNIFD